MRDEEVQSRLAHAFSVLHFDQKSFNPKTPEPLNERFRGIAFKMHPDRFPAERKKEAEARFGQVTEAFHFIMDHLEQMPVPAPASHEEDRAEHSKISSKDIDRLAAERDWSKMAEAVTGLPTADPLRSHAQSLLEGSYKLVLASGQKDAITFMCINTLIPSLICSALRSADEGMAESLLGVMASRGMWKQLRDNVLLGRGPKERSIAAMEDNVDRILREGGEDMIAFLWDNARRKGLRMEIIEKLSDSDRPDSVKPLLERMAERKMAKSLSYCADSVFASNPRLRRYALTLKEVILADEIVREAPPAWKGAGRAFSHSQYYA